MTLWQRHCFPVCCAGDVQDAFSTLLSLWWLCRGTESLKCTFVYGLLSTCISCCKMHLGLPQGYVWLYCHYLVPTSLCSVDSCCFRIDFCFLNNDSCANSQDVWQQEAVVQSGLLLDSGNVQKLIKGFKCVHVLLLVKWFLQLAHHRQPDRHVLHSILLFVLLWSLGHTSWRKGSDPRQKAIGGENSIKW